MHVKRTVTKQKPQRGGFTLIELLVVISIIAVLAALILPGLGAARATARRTQCMSQMRNVSLAMHAYATSKDGVLPYLMSDGSTLVTYFDGTSGPETAVAPWSVALLPYLEFQTLFDRLTSSTPGAGETLTTLRNTSIQVYTCPDDPNGDNGGRLSFAANAGYTTSEFWAASGTSWGAAGTHGLNQYVFPFSAAVDPEIQAATGVFTEQANSGGLKPRLDRLSDGQTNTILLTENLQSGNWHSAVPVQVGFMTPVVGEAYEYDVADNGGIGHVSGTPNADRPQSLAETTIATNWTALGARINQNPGSASGTAPRPSSGHPGVVNVFFADGHGRPLAQEIDDLVWLRLISSGGEKFGQRVQGSDF